MRYRQQYDGDLVRPVMKGYRMMCCDCGKVHILDFRVIRWGRGHKVEFRVKEDARATQRIRRRKASKHNGAKADNGKVSDSGRERA